jgi:hypothetical protein
VPFDDIYDFEPIINIAKQNDVALEGEAADIGAQLRSRTAQGPGQSRKIMALLPYRADKPPAYDELTASRVMRSRMYTKSA